MYKTIVFDLGGVVVDFDPHSFLLDRFYDDVLENTIYNIVFGSQEWKDLDAGLLSREEANAIMLNKAKQANCLFTVQSVLDDWTRMLRTRRKTVEVIKRLKRMGFGIYYLSNIPHDILALLQQREFWHLFDGGIASCDVHINKPDLRIYELLLERYGLNRAETIFIDDSKVNANMAYELGMTGIHFKGSVSFIKALNTCGIPIREHLLW